MGIAQHISDWPGDWDAALAALAWQADLGANEFIGDTPQDRYATAQPADASVAQQRLPDPAGQSAAPQPRPVPEPAAGQSPEARQAVHLAARAGDLPGLRAALAEFDGCDLRRGARNLVFADGHPGARVLVLGEAPGREDDIEGRPFVGREGALLDRMFAAIGLSRSAAEAGAGLYLTLVLPWRPPGDRAASAGEVSLLRPFVQRHIALVNPQVVVVMGASAGLALMDGAAARSAGPEFGQAGFPEAGLSEAVFSEAGRGRGVFGQALGRAVLPMPSPGSLLRNPGAKREVWADLLALKALLARG